MALKFNIIYTPNSVKNLRAFVLSLLEWTDFEFRLVSNGCERHESRLLEKFCSSDSRLEYYHYWTMPTRKFRLWKQAPHGMVLNKLQKMETSEYFAFMDSDVFTVDRLTSDTVLADLRGYAGVFSGSPLWSTTEDQTAPARTGRFNDPQNRTESGMCLGASYFAVYDNRVLSDLIRSTGVKFDVYRKVTSVQRRNHDKLERIGVGADIYDTGKYLNILLQANGHDLLMRNSYPVRHIGGMSFWHIGHEHRVTEPWIPRKHASQRFFGQLMQSLADGGVFESQLEIDEPELRSRILQAADELKALYRKHAGSLAWQVPAGTSSSP
jgi:hypothetical protein